VPGFQAFGHQSLQQVLAANQEREFLMGLLPANEPSPHAQPGQVYSVFVCPTPNATHDITLVNVRVESVLDGPGNNRVHYTVRNNRNAPASFFRMVMAGRIA